MAICESKELSRGAMRREQKRAEESREQRVESIREQRVERR